MQNSNHPGDTKGQAAWQVHRTTRQTDGTSCNSFPRETHITCENRAHDTVPEKDVSSPTFNSGVSRANGMKHALKAFEETIFQLLFSMPDDSVVHSISLGDGCKQGVTQKKKMFSVIHAGGTQSGVSANMTLIQNLFCLGIRFSILAQRQIFPTDSLQHAPGYLPGGQIPGPGCSLTTRTTTNRNQISLKNMCMWAALLLRSVLKTAFSTVAGDIILHIYQQGTGQPLI